MTRIIYEAHTSVRKRPRNYNPEDESLFASAFEMATPATDVATLDKAVILKEMIFSPREFKFYLRYSNILPVSRIKLLKSFKFLLKPGQHVDSGLWLTHEWCCAYFHWFTDALTRWIAVEDMVTDQVVLLPDYYKEHPYVQESLDILGLKAFYYVRRKPLFVKRLLMPGHTAVTGNYNKEIINKLRDKLAATPTVTPWRKIYVSRQKANRRKILNEDAVVELMKKYGYEIHYFEDYSLRQQIAMMSETRTLVGIHGAGLTNMLFMQSGATILELRREKDTHHNFFLALSSDLGHEYYYLNNKGTSEDTHTADLTVDLVQLEKVLVEMEQQ